MNEQSLGWCNYRRCKPTFTPDMLNEQSGGVCAHVSMLTESWEQVYVSGDANESCAHVYVRVDALTESQVYVRAERERRARGNQNRNAPSDLVGRRTDIVSHCLQKLENLQQLLFDMAYQFIGAISMQFTYILQNLNVSLGPPHRLSQILQLCAEDHKTNLNQN